MTTIDQYSQAHIKECYEFYKSHAPIKPGQLVDINDYNGKLYAIGKCVGIYWSEKVYEWIVCAEIMEEIGLCIGEFSAAQCKRHVGFYPEMIK